MPADDARSTTSSPRPEHHGAGGPSGRATLGGCSPAHPPPREDPAGRRRCPPPAAPPPAVRGDAAHAAGPLRLATRCPIALGRAALPPGGAGHERRAGAACTRWACGACTGGLPRSLPRASAGSASAFPSRAPSPPARCSSRTAGSMLDASAGDARLIDSLRRDGSPSPTSPIWARAALLGQVMVMHHGRVVSGTDRAVIDTKTEYTRRLLAARPASPGCAGRGPALARRAPAAPGGEQAGAATGVSRRRARQLPPGALDGEACGGDGPLDSSTATVPVPVGEHRCLWNGAPPGAAAWSRFLPTRSLQPCCHGAPVRTPAGSWSRVSSRRVAGDRCGPGPLPASTRPRARASSRVAKTPALPAPPSDQAVSSCVVPRTRSRGGSAWCSVAAALAARSGQAPSRRSWLRPGEHPTAGELRQGGAGEPRAAPSRMNPMHE